MEEKLKKHEERCFAFTAQRTEFPDDPILNLRIYRSKLKHHLQFMQILKAF